MLKLHPAEIGEFMYINFSNIQSLIENLDNTVYSLVRAKEKIEYECRRLVQNTELEDVIADMKRTADQLENEVLTAKKLKLSLIKISELYMNGEEHIKDAIEGGKAFSKIKFVPYHKLNTNLGFRWTIE